MLDRNDFRGETDSRREARVPSGAYRILMSTVGRIILWGTPLEACLSPRRGQEKRKGSDFHNLEHFGCFRCT